MAAAENVVTAAYTIVALALSLVALRSWRYSGSRRVLYLALGFLLFFVKGVLLSVGLFLTEDWARRLLLPSLAIDLAALGVFYGAVLRRNV